MRPKGQINDYIRLGFGSLNSKHSGSCSDIVQQKPKAEERNRVFPKKLGFSLRFALSFYMSQHSLLDKISEFTISEDR